MCVYIVCVSSAEFISVGGAALSCLGWSHRRGQTASSPYRKPITVRRQDNAVHFYTENMETKHK